jgi:hypothetical protein
MLTDSRSKRFLLVALSVSGLVHLVIILFSAHLPTFTTIHPQVRKPVEVSLMDSSELKRWKTVGITGGVKHFSMPLKPQSATAKKKIIARKKISEGLSLSSIAHASTSSAISRGPDPRDELRSRFDSVNVNAFNIRFEPPEGVNENELNHTEQIFYGFYKRVYESYLSSFVRAWQHFLLTSPIRAQWRNSPQTLIGQVQYDNQGNINRVKFLKGSDDSHYQELFEETLRGINALPNPPQQLVKKDGLFTVYYQLFL